MYCANDCSRPQRPAEGDGQGPQQRAQHAAEDPSLRIPKETSSDVVHQSSFARSLSPALRIGEVGEHELRKSSAWFRSAPSRPPRCARAHRPIEDSDELVVSRVTMGAGRPAGRLRRTTHEFESGSSSHGSRSGRGRALGRVTASPRACRAHLDLRRLDAEKLKWYCPAIKSSGPPAPCTGCARPHAGHHLVELRLPGGAGAIPAEPKFSDPYSFVHSTNSLRFSPASPGSRPASARAGELSDRVKLFTADMAASGSAPRSPCAGDTRGRWCSRRAALRRQLPGDHTRRARAVVHSTGWLNVSVRCTANVRARMWTCRPVRPR